MCCSVSTLHTIFGKRRSFLLLDNPPLGSTGSVVTGVNIKDSSSLIYMMTYSKIGLRGWTEEAGVCRIQESGASYTL